MSEDLSYNCVVPNCQEPGHRKPRKAPMKIRHKGETTTAEVFEDTPTYYIATFGSGYGHFLAPKDLWEPVLAETWVDVTSECVVEGDYLYYQQADVRRVIVGPHCAMYSGYRLRKVTFHEMHRNAPAFIIEKREP